MVVTGSVVRTTTATIPFVIATAVPNTYVQVAVTPKLNITAIMVSRRGWNVIHQHRFTGALDHAIGRKYKTRNPVHRGLGVTRVASILFRGVIHEDEAIRR